MSEPSIAIVIPAYNEAARLEATLEAIDAHLGGAGVRPWVVLADDGSTDGTVALAVSAAERLGIDLRVLSLPHAGKASAVRAGMLFVARQSAADYVLMLDADNEIAVDHLAEVDWRTDRSTVYIGRRVAAVGARAGTAPSPLRRLMSAGMRTLSRLLLGLSYRDTQCGFKLFPRPMVGGLFGQQRTMSWVFDAEILVIASLSRLPIVEVPVVWTPRGVSRVRPTAIFTSLAGLIAIAARRAGRRYRPIQVAE